MKLSLIIPIYRSELNIDNAYEQVKKVLFSMNDFETELIFVNDGSPDNSYTKLLQIEREDDHVKLINLSRNFGMHAAILAGMENATGDIVSSISCDLQDPLELLLEMIAKWKEGHKVVIATRSDREDPFLTKMFSKLYYKMLRAIALPKMPDGGFDYYLIDAQVKDEIVKMKEKNSDIHGQIIWLGYNPVFIEYHRGKREAGTSSWTFSKKFKLFIDSIVAFSYVPIKLVSLLGILFSVLGAFFAFWVLILKLVNNTDVEGWTSLMIITLVIGGVILLTVGIIGEYLWRSYDETRKRPNYVIDEKRGFEK